MADDRVIRFGGVAVLLLAVGWSPAWATLAESLNRATTGAALIDIDGTLVNVPDVPNLFVPAIQALAVRGTDFPATATTAGFAYRLNPELGIFERTKNLGPVFAERAATVGENRFEFGLSMLYANLDQIDGGEFGESVAVFPSRFDQTVDGETFALGNVVDLEEFALKNFTIYLTGTYGITDRWDVNVLLPFVGNQLQVRGTRRALAQNVNDRFDQRVGPPTRIDFEDDSFGVGDLQLRTKYRFLDDPLGLAAGLILRVPTGNEENFAGLGDTTVTPFFVASHIIDRFDLHANVGFEFNAGDIERTRALYAVGVTTQIIEPLAIFVDFLGSSAFTDDDLDIPDAATATAPRGIDQNPVSGAVAIPRSDLLNMAAGLKFSIGDNVTGFAGAIVPVNTDGLRADVIPTGGIEVSF